MPPGRRRVPAPVDPIRSPRPSRARRVLVALWVTVANGVAVGCAPEIGDECETAIDCSSQGSRVCDRTQKGGYCTILGCEKGTCPDEAVCVKFRPEPNRLAVTYCMAKCSSSDDCREETFSCSGAPGGPYGYRCKSQQSFGAGDGQDALVLDGASKKFCSLPLPPGEVIDDAGYDEPMDFMEPMEPMDASLEDATTPNASFTDADMPDASSSDAAMQSAEDDAGAE